MTDSTAAAAAEAERSSIPSRPRLSRPRPMPTRPEASPRPTAAERLADALKTHAPAPEGYAIRWPKPALTSSRG